MADLAAIDGADTTAIEGVVTPGGIIPRPIEPPVEARLSEAEVMPRTVDWPVL